MKPKPYSHKNNRIIKGIIKKIIRIVQIKWKGHH